MDAQQFALAVEGVVKKDVTVLSTELASLGVELKDLFAEAAPIFQEEVKSLEGEVGPLLVAIAKSKPIETMESFVKVAGANAEALIFEWWLKAKLQSLGASVAPASVVAPAATTDDAATAIAGALGH